MSERRNFSFLLNPHFWIIFACFAVLTLLHYPHQIPFLNKLDLQAFLGLERHAFERILFLVPIAYAGYKFGLKGGIICLLSALLVMLPRIIFLSRYFLDALYETFFSLAVAVFINLWLESRRREISFREKTLSELEEKKQELQSFIRSMEESRKRLSVLHAISTIINRSLELDEVLKVTVDHISEVMNLDAIIVFFRDEESDDYRISAHKGMSEEIVRASAGEEFKQKIREILIKTGENYCCGDLSCDKIAREFFRKKGLMVTQVIPLKSREEIIGGLVAASSKQETFCAEDIELLNLVSIELVAAAEKSFFLHEIQRVGKRFQEIFEKAHDAIWIQDKEGRIITANQTTARLTGYSIQELLNFDIARFYTGKGLLYANSMERELLSGTELCQPYEQTIRKKNGDEAVFMLTTSLLKNEKTPAFLYIARDITEQRRLQGSLRLYADQVSNAYEEERKRIARELHDDTIQILVAISRQVDNFISKNRALEPAKLEALEKIQNNVDESLIRIRRFIQDLRPPTLEYLGLLPALRELIYKSKEDYQLKIDFQMENIALNLTKEQELLIYRIVQEALRNIWKHSRADNAEIVIYTSGKNTIISIKDNGKGFMLKKDSQFLEMGKLGLMGMQERAHLLGGSLEIAAQPGEGTAITLIFDSTRI